MNPAEIKSAWNAFKKEAKKEISFNLGGCCFMNAKQIQNGTATIEICNNIEYDLEIARERSEIERVNGYNTWTAEEKKESEAESLAYIERCEAKKAAYGTKANEAEIKAAEIFNSAAFKKLAKAIGIHSYELELVKKWAGLSLYRIRIHY